jgi:hypothetical protein
VSHELKMQEAKALSEAAKIVVLIPVFER